MNLEFKVGDPRKVRAASLLPHQLGTNKDDQHPESFSLLL